MSLNIIIGPMFSGKTTYILNKLNQFSSIDLKCLYINSSKDSREENNDYSTHNPTIGSSGNISSIKCDTLYNIPVDDFDVIGIDEYGLFENYNTLIIEWVEHKKKTVIVCGLNGDFLRRKFGFIIDLIPLADDVKVLNPYCQGCKDKSLISKAIFSKRITDDTDIINIGKDNYKPVCRYCYLSD
jgi:thymidine kinase